MKSQSDLTEDELINLPEDQLLNLIKELERENTSLKKHKENLKSELISLTDEAITLQNQSKHNGTN